MNGKAERDRLLISAGGMGRAKGAEHPWLRNTGRIARNRVSRHGRTQHTSPSCLCLARSPSIRQAGRRHNHPTRAREAPTAQAVKLHRGLRGPSHDRDFHDDPSEADSVGADWLSWVGKRMHQGGTAASQSHPTAGGMLGWRWWCLGWAAGLPSLGCTAPNVPGPAATSLTTPPPLPLPLTPARRSAQRRPPARRPGAQGQGGRGR